MQMDQILKKPSNKSTGIQVSDAPVEKPNDCKPGIKMENQPFSITLKLKNVLVVMARLRANLDSIRNKR